MTTVGVLCRRVRVEEKQLMAALAEAGVLPTALPPADVPLPIGPLPPSTGHPSGAALAAPLIVDRCQDRATAAAIIAACRSLGTIVVDAGLAATGDRLAVASALAAAALPRPATRLVCSPAAALQAFAEYGYPGTLLPLTFGDASLPLPDVDTAEAVLEHRAVLGSGREALALVQVGSPPVTTVVVVGGHAVAVAGGQPVVAAACRLAEATAEALDAAVIGVELADLGNRLVVWDVQPVPEFRHAAAIGGTSVAATLAATIVGRLGCAPVPVLPGERIAPVPIAVEAARRESNGAREVADGVVLTA